MPKQKLQRLMTELHSTFGDAKPSAQQQQLLDDLAVHIHDLNTEAPIDPTPMETMELLLEQVGEEHPRACAVLKECMAVLRGLS